MCDAAYKAPATSTPGGSGAGSGTIRGPAASGGTSRPDWAASDRELQSKAQETWTQMFSRLAGAGATPYEWVCENCGTRQSAALICCKTCRHRNEIAMAQLQNGQDCNIV